MCQDDDTHPGGAVASQKELKTMLGSHPGEIMPRMLKKPNCSFEHMGRILLKRELFLLDSSQEGVKWKTNLHCRHELNRSRVVAFGHCPGLRVARYRQSK